VGGTLDNPQIELRGASGNLVIGNDQWQQPPLDSYRAPFTRPEEVQAVMNAVGAFSLADNSADAAMVVSLDPGVYTWFFPASAPRRAWAD